MRYQNEVIRMTTLLGQLTQQPYTPQRRLVQAPTPRAINPMTRNIEIAALREDQKMHVAQLKAPSIPLFDSAFSAFARGSLMSTPNGEIAVEDLLPGEELNTSTGEPAKILWIGSSTFVPAAPDRRMPLIRIMADTFGQSRPSSFLTVGPSARLLQTPHHLRGDNNGTRMFTKADEFVDGVNVIEICPPHTGKHVSHLLNQTRSDHSWRNGNGNIPPRSIGHPKCQL
jgi:hypothetical protein